MIPFRLGQDIKFTLNKVVLVSGESDKSDDDKK